jgi:hypothetical protein
MKKKEALKTKPLLIKLILALSFLPAFLPYPLTAATQEQILSSPISELERSAPELESLLSRLRTAEEPVSREGAGYLIAQAPGERYKVQFRLIARGPEAFRLEIFDLFGRPSWYLISYAGETHLFSPSQQKEIPFNQTFSGPLAAGSQIPLSEMPKIFWGRVPLLPYNQFQIKPDREAGQDAVRLILKGAGQQEFLITQAPFSLRKSLIFKSNRTEEIEVTFSDFSSVAGNRLPLKCEVRQREKEQVLIIRYETLIPRNDIPDDVFQFPHFIQKNSFKP